MKTIKKFWGVALVVVLLSSLFVAATPVSAAEALRWEVKLDAPSPMTLTIAAGTDPVDYDFNGSVAFACTGAALLQSANGGATWSPATAKAQAALPGMTFHHVAIAPDDANIIVAANNTAFIVISENGGATWTNMGIPNNVGANATLAVLNDVKISPTVSGGIRYVVAYGVTNTGTAGIYYYNYGAGVGAWKEAIQDFNRTVGTPPVIGTEDNAVAFEFSPNFSSDLMGLAVTANLPGGAGDTLKLQMLNFNLLGTWNTETGYPIPVYTSLGVLAVQSASIALGPDYDGSDESMRIAFVGAAITDGGAAAQLGGVWRCIDNTAAVQILGATAATPINSVAFDGTNIAAGAYDTNNVYRCDSPLSSSTTFLSARGLKRIGIDDAGNDLVQVMFRGETLYGAKVGAASAISKSTDYGNVWNDYTLLDSALTTINDIYVGPSGDPWYIAATNANSMSVYRMSAFSVTRVLCVAVTAPAQFMQFDGIATDGNLLYASDLEATGSSAIYYTDNGGLTRWTSRTNLPCVVIADVAVENASTVYIGQAASNTVYKSTNKAFSFGPGVDCKMILGNTIYDMKSIAEGQMVIGGTLGGVTYTTDGGATYTNLVGVIAGGPNIVTASGLAAGDYIFAANVANKTVHRCILGPSNPVGEFKDMNAPAQVSGETNGALVYTNGVLYALSSNATGNWLNRTLVPTIPAATHAAVFWSTQFPGNAAGNMGVLPEGMRASTGSSGNIILYTWDTITQTVYYLDDTVALASPTLQGPADKSLIQIVSPLTAAVSNVNFLWDRLSLSTNYLLQIALDSTFSQIVVNAAVGSPAPVVSSIQLGNQFIPGNTYYWRVSATTPFTSGWSEVRSFIVQPSAASVPVVSSPAIGSIVTNTQPAFSWSPVAGGTSYKFQLDDNIDFASLVYTVDTPVTGVQLPSATKLTVGKTYFWRVKSLTPVESDWSTVANFIVAEAAQPTSTGVPTITFTQPPATTTVITFPTTEPPDQVSPAYIWAIIIIGAVLVIAVIVLIVRTRRSV